MCTTGVMEEYSMKPWLGDTAVSVTVQCSIRQCTSCTTPMPD